MNKSKLPLILGFLMIAAGLYLAISTLTPSGHQKATGTIVDSSSEPAAASFERSIRFQATDGKTYTATDRSYSTSPQTSETVTVAYDPARPQETMKVVSDDGRSTLWGVIVAAVGAILIYLGLRKGPSESQLPIKKH